MVELVASSPEAPFSEDAETAIRATGGNSTLIVRAQLEVLTDRSAWGAVETLNRRWIQARRSRMNIENIETMRYLSAPDATTKYGTGFPGGAIEVTTRRR